jgi:hypothetical protein
MPLFRKEKDKQQQLEIKKTITEDRPRWSWWSIKSETKAGYQYRDIHAPNGHGAPETLGCGARTLQELMEAYYGITAEGTTGVKAATPTISTEEKTQKAPRAGAMRRNWNADKVRIVVTPQPGGVD